MNESVKTNLFQNQSVPEFDLANAVQDATAKRMADHLKSCELSKQLKERGINVYTHRGAYYWIAVDDNTYYYRGDPLGTGRTEQEAIEDLVEQLSEDI